MYPFAEAGYKGSYRESLNAPVYGLWSGKTSREDFLEQFELAIERGLRRAWKEGLAKAGIEEDEMTQDEEIDCANFILEQYKYVPGFADFIEANSRANKGKLANLQYRLNLWASAYQKAVNAAFAAAEANPLVGWLINPAKENCTDCLYASSRVYRKSVWIKWGWTPGNGETECSIGCGCEWKPVAKGTRANKGHPRRPKGK